MSKYPMYDYDARFSAPRLSFSNGEDGNGAIPNKRNPLQKGELRLDKFSFQLPIIYFEVK